MGVACGQGVVGVVYLTSDHYSIVIPVLNVKASRIRFVLFAIVAILAFCAGTVRMPAMPMWTGYPVMLVLNAVSGLRPMAIAASFLLASWWGKSRKSITPATNLSFRLKVRLSTDFGHLRDVVVISDKTIGEQGCA